MWIAISVLLPIHATAGNDDLHIQELLVGANGDSRIQFIRIEQHSVGENLWGPQEGESQARAMLVFFDAAGRETGTFRFPVSPQTGGSLSTLIATPEFAALPGAPQPDVVIPPLLHALAGKVCFRSNPQSAAAEPKNECVSYGEFAGDTGIDESGVRAGPPGPPLPITGTVSLRRTGYSRRNVDFAVTNDPTPLNTAGDTFAIPLSTQAVQGETLFNNETFEGNGRTCASCHVRSAGFGLSPANVQSRYQALAAPTLSFDPLFISESTPSAFDRGFDFNLNTLELMGQVTTPAPCTGELRGVIMGANGGLAKVLARVGPATYLVYGGLDPALSGTVSDGVCSGMVRNMISGDLAATERVATGLEVPARMRDSGDPIFPEGRALILENIDGFENPPVFRRSPHLLNLASTAPYGLSGEFEDLETFATGAVVQHFPRTQERSSEGARPDFRLPTAGELAALEAFMLAQEFPATDDPNKRDLARFATTDQQRKGREEFFSFGCATCHGGPTLSQTTVPILGHGEGVNGAFNTGTASINIRDALPCEPGTESVGPCGSREFSTPQLFNLPELGPYFHNGSARTLAEAVDFYGSFAFGRSPAGQELIFLGISIVPTDAMTTFLEALVVRPYTLSDAPLRFGAHSVGTGPGAVRSVAITNTGAVALGFDSSACRIAGRDASEFEVTSCGLTPALAPGATRTIEVRFDPSSEGLKSAILEIHSVGIVPSGVDLFGVGGALGPAPELSEVAPASGSAEGGETITLRGTNFMDGAAVTVGGVRAGWIRIVSPTLMTAQTPRRADGTADVLVVNPDGQTSVLVDAYTYAPTSID